MPQGNLITPIFSGTIQYQPFKQTQLTLSASRSVSPSYYQSQYTETTSVSAGLSQRLLHQFNLALGGGYSTIRLYRLQQRSFGGKHIRHLFVFRQFEPLINEARDNFRVLFIIARTIQMRRVTLTRATRLASKSDTNSSKVRVQIGWGEMETTGQPEICQIGKGTRRE